MLKKILINPCFVSMFIITFIFGGSSCWLVPFGDQLVRDTQFGKVRGIMYDHNTIAWLGIPYAKPPTKENNLRWKAPVDPDRWEGVRDSLASVDECVPCAQMAHHPITWENTGSFARVSGSEDCLVLNVFRPHSKDRGLPVYVWIHGGANNYGGAAEYDRAFLASKAKAVVVVIQYRLGPFGWLYHSAFQSDPARTALDNSGNFGTLDTIKALQWVKNNIDNFGGNPRNVTVGGESAGAHNTGNLLVTSKANGLYQRVMMQSRAMPLRSTAQAQGEAETLIARLATAAGVPAPDDKKAFLEGRTTEEIINAYWFPVMVAQSAGAIQDGTVIPYVAYDPALITAYNAIISSGNYNKVPVILGNNMDEVKYFTPMFGLLVKYAFAIPTYQDYPFFIKEMIPSGYFSWLDLYKTVNPDLVADSPGTTPTVPLTLDMVLPTQIDKDLYAACSDYGSLAWKTTYTDDIARVLKSQPGQTVYAYYFKWAGDSTQADYRYIMGAAHTTEIPFFAGLDTDTYGGMAFSPSHDTQGRKRLAGSMMKYLTHYIHRGNPNGDRLPEWKEWDNAADAPKCIEFDATDTDAVISMSTRSFTQANVYEMLMGHYMTLPANTRGAMFLFGTW